MEQKITSTIRLRMSSQDAHYGGNLVDGARDIGGILNKEGKCICYNRMIRSDALNKITIQDVEYLKHLGLKTIVDFRGKQEVIKAPDIKIEGVKEINLSPNAEVANLASGNIVDDQQKIDALIKISSTQEGRLQLKARSDEMSEQMRELVNSSYANKQYTSFINLLTDENNLPLLHHCKGGKDRTGFATIITLFILDVSLEKVKEEYMLTKECMASRNEKRMNEYRQYTNDPFVLEYLSGLMQTKEVYFDAAIDEMIKLAGSIPNYLEKYLDVTLEKKEKIKRKMSNLPGGLSRP